LFQQLAAQNVETLNDLFEGVERVDRKIVVTCPHCFNTIGREYKQLGANFTVLHHTQLLNRLVRDNKLVPVTPVSQDVTYHDPCYLGRHNKVYEAPRELIEASGVTLREMPRHAETGLCCGAGGARMWMEEHIGKRVNHERVDEAIMTDTSKIATGCPFCRVMMTDGLTDRQEAGKGEGMEVLDVAQLLLGAIDRNTVTLPAKKKPEQPAPAAPAPPEAPAAKAATAEAPAAGDGQKAAKPVTGLGIAGGAKRPGAKKAAPAPAAETAAPAPPAAPVKGLGIAAGAKRPGAKKAAPAAAGQAEPVEAQPVKGLGIAAGAKRPGAHKATGTAVPKPAEPAAESQAPEGESQPDAPVKGLGIARGARPPGKR
ncbi:MAG TPA: (Fe-S)-binding protein, partial [Mycobacterium sp.]|nr:(Fe-S)-binding protein [Mycobacterium sp.]